MKVLDVCKNYFNRFQEVSDFRKNDSTKNVLAALKVLSYFTVVIPLSFAIAYGAASLYGRVSKKQDLSHHDQSIHDKAKTTILKKDNTTDSIKQEPMSEIHEKNEPRSISELFVEAERQFTFHPLKDEVLIRLKDLLQGVIVENSFTFGGARIYKTKEETQKEGAIEDALESFFGRKDLFPNLEMIIYGGLILSREKMKHQILEEAEKFVKSIPLEHQKDVLNYIRQVTYNRKFLKNPIAYINKWIEDRGSEDIIHRFPSDDALAFFKLIMYSRLD